MIYLGNYAGWIKDEWIEYLLNHQGHPRPNNKPAENDFENIQNSAVANTGYDMSKTYWYKFLPDNFPFDLSPPIDVEVSQWWFVKMVPGNVIPLHIDQEEEEGHHTTLYWMSLSDYTPGHVFICKDKLLTDYKKGDLFRLEHANDLHGSCNMGFEPRLIFNFTTYRK